MKGAGHISSQLIVQELIFHSVFEMRTLLEVTSSQCVNDVGNEAPMNM